MSSSTQSIVSQREYWIRVYLTLEICVKEALIEVVHNKQNDLTYNGIPEDGTDLYNFMVQIQQNKKHPLHKVLRIDQWIILCPPSKQTNTKDWDITLLIAVIRSVLNIKPFGGWNVQAVDVNDKSIGAFVFSSREIRNALKHGTLNDIITPAQFSSYWNKIEAILKGLNYSRMNVFHRLKTEPLDPHVASIGNILKDLINEVDELKDMATENTKDIAHIMQCIEYLKQHLKHLSSTKADKSDLDQKANKRDLAQKADKKDLDQKADKSEISELTERFNLLQNGAVQEKKKQQSKCNLLNVERNSVDCIVFSVAGAINAKSYKLFYCKNESSSDTESDIEDGDWIAVDARNVSIISDTQYGKWTLFKVQDFFTEDDSGYNFNFKLLIQVVESDKEVDYISQNIELNDDKAVRCESSFPSKIICIAPNNGLESNIHCFTKYDKMVKRVGHPFQKMLQSLHCVSNVVDFRQQAEDYFLVNVEENSFPPKHYIKSDYVLRLVTYLQNSYKDSFVIIGYDYQKHLLNYGFSKNDLKKLSIEQVIDCKGEASKAHMNEQSVLFIEPTNNIIIYFRVMLPTIKSSASLKQELSTCNDFLKSFLLLHENKVREQHTAVSAMVLASGITRQELDQEKFCFLSHAEKERFAITKNDLDNPDQLKKIVFNLVKCAQECRKQGKGRNVKNVNSNSKESLHSIKCETVAIFALITTRLPQFTKDPNEQVRSLFLNKDQIAAIHDKNPWIILKGPFGSGKTLILQEIAKILFASMLHGTIYYVCFDPYSLLEVEMEEFFSSDETFKDDEKDVRLQTFNIYDMLKNVDCKDKYSLPTMLEHYQGNDENLVSFLVDETDGERFTKEYAQSVKECLTKYGYSKSKVVFAMHSVEKERTLYHQDGKSQIDSNCIEKQYTGMVVLPFLSKCMRTVKDLFELGKIAEEEIQKGTYRLVVETTKKPVPAEQEETKPSSSEVEDKMSNLSIEKKRIKKEKDAVDEMTKSRPSTGETALQPLKMKTGEKKLEKTPPPKKIEVPTVPNAVAFISPKLAVVIPKPESQIPLPSTPTKPQSQPNTTSNVSNISSPVKNLSIDVLSSLYPEIVDDTTVVSKYVNTQVKFVKAVSGNKIPCDSAAVAVYLDKDFSFDSVKSAILISTILKVVCLGNDLTSSIICSRSIEASFLKYCFVHLMEDFEGCFYVPSFLGGIPGFVEKKEVYNQRSSSLQTAVLVTDFRGFRGCETEHCIAFVDQEDHYTQHVLIEIISRAVVKLHMFVLPSRYAVDERVDRQSLYSVLEAWKENDKLHFPDIDITDEMVVIDGEKHTLGYDRKMEADFKTFISECEFTTELKQHEIRKHIDDYLKPHVRIVDALIDKEDDAADEFNDDTGDMIVEEVDVDEFNLDEIDVDNLKFDYDPDYDYGSDYRYDYNDYDYNDYDYGSDYDPDPGDYDYGSDPDPDDGSTISIPPNVLKFASEMVEKLKAERKL